MSEPSIVTNLRKWCTSISLAPHASPYSATNASRWLLKLYRKYRKSRFYPRRVCLWCASQCMTAKSFSCSVDIRCVCESWRNDRRAFLGCRNFPHNFDGGTWTPSHCAFAWCGDPGGWMTGIVRHNFHTWNSTQIIVRKWLQWDRNGDCLKFTEIFEIL